MKHNIINTATTTNIPDLNRHVLDNVAYTNNGKSFNICWFYYKFDRAYYFLSEFNSTANMFGSFAWLWKPVDISEDSNRFEIFLSIYENMQFWCAACNVSLTFDCFHVTSTSWVVKWPISHMLKKEYNLIITHQTPFTEPYEVSTTMMTDSRSFNNTGNAAVNVDADICPQGLDSI